MLEKSPYQSRLGEWSSCGGGRAKTKSYKVAYTFPVEKWSAVYDSNCSLRQKGRMQYTTTPKWRQRLTTSRLLVPISQRRWTRIWYYPMWGFGSGVHCTVAEVLCARMSIYRPYRLSGLTAYMGPQGISWTTGAQVTASNGILFWSPT